MRCQKREYELQSLTVGCGECIQQDELLPLASDSLGKVENYEAILHFSCGIIVWNKILLGWALRVGS